MTETMEQMETGTMRNNALLGILLAVVTIVADQMIKFAVESNLTYHQPVEVLPFFSLFYTFNTGIAFSFMNNLPPLALVVMAVAVMGIMVFFWWSARRDGLVVALGYGLIIGGAIGNLIDRAAYGHVIDYVLLHTDRWSFAVFNLADAALTLGVILILISALFASKKPS